MKRADNLSRLRTETFDLCIIGGGASGAGCALDAALRGMKVALVEKNDFAAGTSSRSTKLIHGGVRYLEQAFKNLDFAPLRQVRHGLEERQVLLNNAPHLARPLALLTPVNSWLEGLYFSIGLKLYDWFAAGKGRLPKSRWLRKAEALQRMPGLSDRMHSAVLYYDGQMDDARYCLALVQSACEAGAAMANYLEVVDFQKDKQGRLVMATLRDSLSAETFPLKARQFLNCSGPFADPVRQLANPVLPPRLRPSKGVHLVLPAAVLPGKDALLIPKTPDGRMVFAIPFEGQVLLGTTDTEYADGQKEPVLQAEELAYLLATLQPYLAQKIDKKQVMAGFGGLRPLLAVKDSLLPMTQKAAGWKAKRKSTKNLLRDHEVEYDPVSGLLSLLGGKWTTYRLMARDAVDTAAHLLGIQAPCTTAGHPLVGAAAFEADNWQKLAAEFGFDQDVSRHLLLKYGGRAGQVAALARTNPLFKERLLAGFPFLKAEIAYAVREEMACSLRDFLARRIRLECTDWQAAKQAAPLVSEIMGAELGWDAHQHAQQTLDYQQLIESFQQATGSMG